jgi:hypothetical protein
MRSLSVQRLDSDPIPPIITLLFKMKEIIQGEVFANVRFAVNESEADSVEAKARFSIR